MRRRGISLVEIIIIISVIGVLAALSIPVYLSYRLHNDLRLAEQQVVQGLGRARLLSQSGQGGSAWGFYVPAGTVYKGESYASRDPQYDETFPMPSSVRITGGLFEVSFSKLEGRPNPTGDVTLTIADGTIVTVPIVGQEVSVSMSSISSSTASSVFGGSSSSSSSASTMTVCHKPGTYAQATIIIATADWNAHQAHGDTEGACAGPASPPPCPSLFTFAANGGLITSMKDNLTFTGVASELTFGMGGPDVDMTADFTSNDGSSWSSLFNKGDIEAHQVKQRNNITAASHVALRFTGIYKQGGTLLYDETAATNDGSDHTLLLRRGDPLPAYLLPAPLARLRTALAGLIDGTDHVIIDPCSVLALAELDAVPYPPVDSEDFTDAIVLVHFDPSP